MCNLYSVRISPDELRELLGYIEEPDFPPRPYVSPGSPIAIVRGEKGVRHFALVRWGFVPSWAKEVAPGKPLTNARVETVLGKASFLNAVRRRRCLIPADGFYEWAGEPGRKQAYYICRSNKRPFAFGGLWEHWMGADGSELETAAIITRDANAIISQIYHRMPLIVPPEQYELWLDNETTEAECALQAALSASNDDLVLEPVQLERRPAPKRHADGEQLKLI